MKTVFVGMSGGVDSSVAAALLVEQGYRVVGVFMKNWTQDIGGVHCSWQEDVADARAVAAHLGIPLKIFDFQDQYKHKVVDYMVAEYAAGRTPNPDMMCNQEIKFKLFLDTALEQGADYIATGHYARIQDGKLLAGLDAAKDQSYFLGRISAAALPRTLMPLGELTKPETRAKAKALGLATAEKPDSQGICFVGEVGMKPFLSQYVETTPGDIILRSTGAIIGQHDGAIFYTVGQRHGLGVGGGKPYYVIGKDMSRNEIYVTDNPDDLDLHVDTFTIADVRWLDAPKADAKITVRSRYRGALITATLSQKGDIWKVRLERPERAISPGQSAVIYAENRVLGAGIITL